MYMNCGTVNKKSTLKKFWILVFEKHIIARSLKCIILNFYQNLFLKLLFHFQALNSTHAVSVSKAIQQWPQWLWRMLTICFWNFARQLLFSHLIIQFDGIEVFIFFCHVISKGVNAFFGERFIISIAINSFNIAYNCSHIDVFNVCIVIW